MGAAHTAPHRYTPCTVCDLVWHQALGSCLAHGLSGCDSDRLCVLFTGSDSNHTTHWCDEDLAIANLARARGVDDGVYAALDVIGCNDDFDFYFG